MRQWNRSETIVRLIVFGGVLMCLVAMVQSRTYFVPSDQKVSIVESVGNNRGSVRDNELDKVTPLVESTALSVLNHSQNQFMKRRGYDEYDYGGYDKYHYGDDILTNPAPKKVNKFPEIRGIQHVAISDYNLDHIGSMIATSLKYLLIVLLVVGIPILATLFVLIPLKILLGLKLMALAHMITLGVLAAKYLHKYKHGWDHGGYGGYGGYGGGGAAGLLGGLAAISTPIVTSNFQQPISQPVTTVVTAPVQQQQNIETWNYPYYYPWLYYYPGFNNTGSNSNTNTNTNTNTNINTNNR